jgi:8-oxo-dGTP diphosphatase
MKVVMAAVVEKDGKYMICRRGPGRRLEGVWEFPGGKLEAGETPEQGLVRELREELKIETEIGTILDAQLESEFHEFIILYYKAQIISGEPALTEHSEIRYVLPCELKEYEFSTADAKAAERLAKI